MLSRTFRKARLMKCHSVRDRFVAILLVSMVSMMIIYEMSFPWTIQRAQEDNVQMMFVGKDQHSRTLKRSVLVREKSPRLTLKSNGYDDTNYNQSVLFSKLVELEERILGLKTGQRPLHRRALVKGGQAVLDQELPVYEPALKKHGFVIQVPRWYREQSINQHTEEDNSGVSMLLVLEDGWSGNGPQNCTNTARTNQKVNQIPEYLQQFTPHDNFCHMTRWANQLRAMSDISSPCYVLPQHEGELRQAMERSHKGALWSMKPVPQAENSPCLFCTDSTEAFQNIKRLSSEGYVATEMTPGPLLISSTPFTVRAHVLVTSVLPLRAYIHSQATLHFMTNLPKSKPSNVAPVAWPLEQLKEHVYEKYGQDAVSTLSQNLHSSVTKILLLASHLTKEFNSVNRCVRCFQLLEVDVIFNSTFHAFVLEVRGAPHVEYLSSWTAYASKQRVVEDMVAVVSSQTSVAQDLFKLLAGMQRQTTFTSPGCEENAEACLHEMDIGYLLDSRRESLASGAFQKLYPNKEGDQYLDIIRELSDVTGEEQSDQSLSSPGIEPFHQYSELLRHSMLVNAERFYSSLAAEETDVAYDDVNIPINHERKNDDSVGNEINLQEMPRTVECSKDKSKLPYLAMIHFEPAIRLSPPFQAVTSEYMATVEYSTFLVKIWAMALSCSCEARLEEKYGLARPANLSVGLGDNKITIFVVDLSHDEPWVLNTYSVIIYRKGPTEGMPPFQSTLPHSVCTIKQDCSLTYSPNEPCGLKRVSQFPSWATFEEHISALPGCRGGDMPGQWYVPCEGCMLGAVCHWGEAVWQPLTCQHRPLDRPRLKACFTDKKVLFIGDSTNRGMLHYIAEQINGSLTEWDKTHNIKVYRSLNDGQTSLSFAYYPQFWLPAENRPVFEEALHHLTKRAFPLENSTNTLLVVGGVHWLSTHHINVILNKLHRDGLTGIRVIVKGLGAGFHQPADGLHCLTKTEQQKLLHRNQLVTQFARNQGFHILETFNMTMGRYKDFLQGKCACHFHRVSPIRGDGKSKTAKSNKDQRTSRDKLANNNQPKTALYHVEGDINAIYSEILMNLICDDTISSDGMRIR